VRFALAAAALLLLGACTVPEPDRDERLAYEANMAAQSDTPPGPPAGAGAAEAVTLPQLLRAEEESGGTLGIAAIHLPSGRRIAHNAAERFPMASTFKLTVALAVLARVDSGRISLDERVQMVWLMMYGSDNTSTDKLMRMVGGPAAIDAHLRSRGIDGIRVDRYEGEVHWQYAGVRDVPPESEWTLQRFESLTSAVPRAQKDSAHAAFFRDPRDTATPEAYAELMAQVARGEGLSPASHRFLLDAMQASPTGLRRIRGALPEGTVVADKTGTIGSSTNDVGLITLPDGSQVAVAVFVKGSPRRTQEVEPSLARAARLVYDHFAGVGNGTAVRQ
jgi:beta-lactamase class A